MRNRGMKLALALVLIGLSSFAGGATRNFGGKTLSFASTAFHKRYSTVIFKDELANTPKWEKNAENPPLSARKAIAIADSVQRKLVEDIVEIEWKCKSAALIFEDEDCFWQIRYESAYLEWAPQYLDLYVTMDGKVVETEVSDDK